MKASKRHRIWDIMKHPDREETLEETYDELESDLMRRMEGIQNQIAMTQDKRNTIIRVNWAAKTALEVFDDILNKPKLDWNDLQLIIEKIRAYEDHIEVQLKADVDNILRSGELDQPAAVAAMAPISLDRSEKTIEPIEPHGLQSPQRAVKGVELLNFLWYSSREVNFKDLYSFKRVLFKERRRRL